MPEGKFRIKHAHIFQKFVTKKSFSLDEISALVPKNCALELASMLARLNQSPSDNFRRLKIATPASQCLKLWSNLHPFHA